MNASPPQNSSYGWSLGSNKSPNPSPTPATHSLMEPVSYSSASLTTSPYSPPPTRTCKPSCRPCAPSSPITASPSAPKRQSTHPAQPPPNPSHYVSSPGPPHPASPTIRLSSFPSLPPQQSSSILGAASHSTSTGPTSLSPPTQQSNSTLPA